jgi:phosphohistidine phosphatase
LIRLYLIRHAADEKRAGSRSLTRRGRSRFRCVARAFAELEEPVDLICASPKQYARETAEILARSLDQEEVLVLDELSPREPARALLRALASRAADCDGIAIVGHKRQLRELLSALGLRKRELPLRKGGVLRIDVDRLARPRASVPRFRLRRSAGELRDAFCGLRKVA